MTDYELPVSSGNIVSAEEHEAAVNDSLQGLQTQIDAMTSGVLVVGQWDAGSGAFPTTRPDSSAIQAGDVWLVSGGGTVDGVTFSVADRLVALVDGGGATYSGSWLRAAYADMLSGFERAAYASVSAMLASIDPARGTGAIWRAGGYRFQEAASGASDHDLTTAGGVKLYVLANGMGAVTPLQFGAAGDGSSDDQAEVAAALAFRQSEGGVVALTALHGLGSQLDVERQADIRGYGAREAGFKLNAAGAKIEVGGSATAAAVGADEVNLQDFIIDGADTAQIGLELSEDPRDTPTSLSDAIWTGGATIRNVRVSACTQIGVHVGADSDNSHLIGVEASANRSEGTSADGIRVEAPCHLSHCASTGNTGYCLRSDVDSAVSGTPDTNYTVEASRFNTGVLGLIYHNGGGDAGAAAAVANFHNCFFENTGFSKAGETVPDLPADSETTLEPAAIRCDAGRVNIVTPKKFQGGWARSLLKAVGSGSIFLDTDNVSITGNSGSRDLDIFMVGSEADHSAQIDIGGLTVDDPADFTRFGMIWPRRGDFPLRPRSYRIGHRQDGSDAFPFDVGGYSLAGVSDDGSGNVPTVTEDGDPTAGGTGLSLQCQGSGANNKASYTLKLPEAEGRFVVLRAVIEGRDVGSVDEIGLLAALKGSGLSLLDAEDKQWREGDGYGVPTFHCWGAYVTDGTQDIEVELFANKNTAGVYSDQQAIVWSWEILILDRIG